jgi:hypothetical protein
VVCTVKQRKVFRRTPRTVTLILQSGHFYHRTAFTFGLNFLRFLIGVRRALRKSKTTLKQLSHNTKIHINIKLISKVCKRLNCPSHGVTIIMHFYKSIEFSLMKSGFLIYCHFSCFLILNKYTKKNVTM